MRSLADFLFYNPVSLAFVAFLVGWGCAMGGVLMRSRDKPWFISREELSGDGGNRSDNSPNNTNPCSSICCLDLLCRKSPLPFVFRKNELPASFCVFTLEGGKFFLGESGENNRIALTKSLLNESFSLQLHGMSFQDSDIPIVQPMLKPVE